MLLFTGSNMNPLAGIVLVFSVLNIPHSVLGTLQPRPGNPLSSCTLKNSSERRYRNGTRSGVIQEMWSCTSIEALDDSAEEEETSSRLRRRGIVDIACSDWEYKLPAGQAIPDVGELADILASLGTEGLFTDPCPEPNEVVRFTKGGWSFTGENRDDNNRCNKLGTMGKFLEKLYDFCERDGGSAFGGGYGNDDVYPQLYSLFPSALAAEVGEEEKPDDSTSETTTATPNITATPPANSASTPEETSTLAGAIAGGVAGGIVAIGLIAFLLRYRRRNQALNGQGRSDVTRLQAAELDTTERGHPPVPQAQFSAQGMPIAGPNYPFGLQVAHQNPTELDSSPIYEPLLHTGGHKERKVDQGHHNGTRSPG